MTKTYDQSCPIARTLDLIGERWTLLILRDLFLGTTRFNEFAEHSPGIPTALLSDRLKSLEAAGLIERHVYNDHPLRAEYYLTARGRSLQPVLSSMFDWGMSHLLDASERRRITGSIERRRASADGTPMRRARQPRM